MFIGDTEITRDQMPSFDITRANPSHLEQSFQDIFNAKLQMAPTGIPNDENNLPSQEGGVGSWN